MPFPNIKVYLIFAFANIKIKYSHGHSQILKINIRTITTSEAQALKDEAGGQIKVHSCKLRTVDYLIKRFWSGPAQSICHLLSSVLVNQVSRRNGDWQWELKSPNSAPSLVSAVLQEGIKIVAGQRWNDVNIDKPQESLLSSHRST